MTTIAEKRHLDRVAALGCSLCRHLNYGESPAEIHHIREGQGMAQRAQHWLAIPSEDGMFLVVYITPGEKSVTVVRPCRTREQADSEAERLNAEQVRREKEIRWERELRGLGGVYPNLEGV